MPVTPPTRPRRAAFTLIELLVVIAVIALLIAILLPALGRARNNARIAISLSNCRQILIASAQYRFETSDQLPERGWTYSPAGNMSITSAWDTWAYGGKDCFPG